MFSRLTKYFSTHEMNWALLTLTKTTSTYSSHEINLLNNATLGVPVHIFFLEISKFDHFLFNLCYVYTL